MDGMNAEIVAIGSELLFGQIVDTNSSFIAQLLSENGIELVRTSTVGDDLNRIAEALQEAMNRSSIVITTGGLGPTEDDLTRESVAQVTGRPLVFQPHLMEQIETIFRKRGFKMVDNNRRQAFIPQGSLAIENPKGTAPGFIVESPEHVMISIPGVPSEMKFLMHSAVIPYLREHFQLKDQVIHYKVLRACGLGEGAIGLQIQDLMKGTQNPSVGTLAAIGDVKIRIATKAASPEDALRMIQKTEDEIRSRLGILIYGVDEETLQGNIARTLDRLHLTLSVIETFTGGLISQKLSGVDCSSFLQGVVLPSEKSQRKFLNLKEEPFRTLIGNPKRFTEVLARGARDLIGADIALATFAHGSEGQGGGEYRIESCYALETPQGTETQELPVGGEPLTLRERASIFALDLLRKYLVKVETRG
jgi:competence/damage-inducible protein CinA-like protein